MAVVAVEADDAAMTGIGGAAAGGSVMAAHAGGGGQEDFGVVGGGRGPTAGGVARNAGVGSGHVATGLVAERSKGGVVAAHAGGGGFAVRERGFVAVKALRRDKMARVAKVAGGDGERGAVQAAFACGGCAVVAVSAAAGHLVVVHQAGGPSRSGGVAGIAHGR